MNQFEGLEEGWWRVAGRLGSANEILCMYLKAGKCLTYFYGEPNDPSIFQDLDLAEGKRHPALSPPQYIRIYSGGSLKLGLEEPRARGWSSQSFAVSGPFRSFEKINARNDWEDDIELV